MEPFSAPKAPHCRERCELTGALYGTHRSGESSEKALLQIPFPGGKMYQLVALKQDFHFNRFVWKEDVKWEMKQEGGE